jgi:hypothetical protein
MPPNLKCDPYLLHKLHKSFPSLILVTVLARLHLLLAMGLPLSLGSGLNTVLMSLSPVVGVHPSSLGLTFTMPNASLTLARLTTLPKLPKCSEKSPTRASHLRLSACN